jgi:hypothetical protein
MRFVPSMRGVGVLGAVGMALCSLGCLEKCEEYPPLGSSDFGPPNCPTLFETRLQGTLKGVAMDLTLQTEERAYDNRGPEGPRYIVRFLGADGRTVPGAELILGYPEDSKGIYDVPLHGSLALPGDPTKYVFREGSIFVKWSGLSRATWYHLILDEGLFNGCSF